MYQAPLRDLRFVLDELLGTQSLAGPRGLDDYSTGSRRAGAERSRALRGNRARAAEPERRPAKARAGPPKACVAAKGFKAAYEQYVAGGWPRSARTRSSAGRPCPTCSAPPCASSWAPRISRSSCARCSRIGAVEALELCGSPEQKERYLPKMVSGEWTGTMVLTEPHAGSDLGLIRTRAVPDGNQLPAVRAEDLHHLGRARSARPTSFTWCSRASMARRPARAAFRCSSCRSSW